MIVQNKTQQKIAQKLKFLQAPVDKQYKEKDKPKDYLSKLYTTPEVIDSKTLDFLNKRKYFKYGYNSEYDFVCISKDGRVGEFYKVSNLIIGVPKAPRKIYKRSRKEEEQYWEIQEMPNERYIRRKGIKNRVDFQRSLSMAPPKDAEILEDFIDYSNIEFKRRDEGFWFYNKGIPTYITGSHYFYLQWAKIDVGAPQYRDANRIFFYFWEACKADSRCYGMCYLKNRRSGFSFMASSEIVNLATQSFDSQYGMMSKTGGDASSLFTKRVVPISLRLPFFFRPIQSGEEKPKSVLEYAIPSEKLSKKKYKEGVEEDASFLEDGLDTTISWKNTSNNAYDGEKLKMLILDEAGKIEKKQGTIEESWLVHRTCLELGRNIVGKCMMGSTCNALNKGGDEFKRLYYQSDLNSVKRDGNGQTPSGLYAMFVPMEFGSEGFIDKYGFPVFETPEVPIEGIDGKMITIGIIDYWKNKVKGLKSHPDSLNEYYRQYPRTEDDAFRDEAKNSIFNLAKIYEQIYHNNEFDSRDQVTRGKFVWENGVKDSRVKFIPESRGRFYLSWIPPLEMQNAVEVENGMKKPGNTEFGVFGCDSYDISGVVDGSGSKGALHGLTLNSFSNQVPDNEFFLEYIARPQTAELFYEDVLMAIHFYGMPVLIENNKPRLLYYLKDRGYRRFCSTRPDKRRSELSITEIELGGIPNTSDNVKQMHAAAVESYIEEHIGHKIVDNKEVCARMPFNRTLEDWARFDITKRTKHDATISSGFAIMNARRHLYAPVQKVEKKVVHMPFGRYDNSGYKSVRIRQQNV